MRLRDDIREAVFRRRLNRFAAEVDLAGGTVLAHVPNSGRLGELLVPGQRVYLAPTRNPNRKTSYDLVLVDAGVLVSVDARAPSTLVREALMRGRLEAFTCYPQIQPEVTYGRSRLDFRLDGEGAPVLLEVKSVSLVRDGVAMFPDAPTERGTRHLEELVRAVGEGYRGAVIFVVQREDARSFRPNVATDPAFDRALRVAVAVGVEVYAHPCRVAHREMKLLGARLPLEL